MNCIISQTPSLISFEEAVLAADAGALDLPWTENSWKKIRGSLTRMRAVYAQLACDRTPEQILCDPGDLEELVGPFKKAHKMPPNCGFKSYQAFYDCQSNVKRFFDLVSGQRARALEMNSRQDVAARLLQHLSTADDGKPLLLT